MNLKQMKGLEDYSCFKTETSAVTFKQFTQIVQGLNRKALTKLPG